MYLVKIKRSPYYQIVYKNNQGKMTTKSTNEKRKSDALIYLSEFKSHLFEKNKVKNILLSEFHKEYMIYIKPKYSIKYVKSIDVAFNQFEKFIGKKYLNEIDHRQSEMFILKQYSKSKFMAAAFYRILKSVFTKAKDWKYISENPFKKFKLPKLPTTLPAFINYDQFCLIIENTKLQILKDIYSTAFYTGLRLGELINLKWNMIDFENGIITLRQSESFLTKNKRERTIPINKTLFEILIRIYNQQSNREVKSFVFKKLNRLPINGDWVSKSFKRTVKEVGLDNKIHFHTLRHSFASNLIKSGVSVFVVKELLGHADIGTTQIYTHIKDESLIEAVKHLDRAAILIKQISRVKSKIIQSLDYNICLN